MFDHRAMCQFRLGTQSISSSTLLPNHSPSAMIFSRALIYVRQE